MSEYWVSHKKYLCKYCNIYIADDAPSRRQHETGLRHKGNVERFVRGLYKAGEKRKQDSEEEKREMARIERAANAAFAQDVGSGLAKAGGSSSAALSSAAAVAGPKAAAKPSNPYANYTTAESLGYVDPDAERAKAESERRRTQGVAGEWQFVDVVLPPEEQVGMHAEQGGNENGVKQEGAGAGAGVEVQTGEKRPVEELVDEEDGRAWKLRRKVTSVGLGELYDPGEMPIKLKPKKEELAQTGSSSAGLPLGGSEKPKWSARGWSKPGASSTSTDKVDGDEGDQAAQANEGESLGESASELIPSEVPAYEVKTEEIKPEPTEPETPLPAPSGGSLFKKRKVPVGGGNKGGRRV